MIIEIRTSDPSDPSSLKSAAWTVMPLFNPALEPYYGRWRLPVYSVPTNLAVDTRQIAETQHHSDMQLLIRIGTASDPLQDKFNGEDAARSYYNLAPFHREFVQKSQSMLRVETPEEPRSPMSLTKKSSASNRTFTMSSNLSNRIHTA